MKKIVGNPAQQADLANFVVDYPEIHSDKFIHDRSSLIAPNYEKKILIVDQVHTSSIKTRLT